MKVYAAKEMVMDGYVVRGLYVSTVRAKAFLDILVNFTSKERHCLVDDGSAYYYFNKDTGHIEFEIEEMEVL